METCVKRGLTQYLVLLNPLHSSVFQISEFHGGGLSAPHLDSVKDLSYVVPHLLHEHFRRIVFDGEPFLGPYFCQPLGDLAFGRAFDFQVIAVACEGSYFLCLSIVADTDDGGLGLFDDFD